MLQVGQKAPEFNLPNTKKELVSLSSLAGQQVVLLFFPMAFTSVCTTELCTIRDDYSQYERLNAKVFGVSVDSPFTLAKFKELENLNFDLLSDFNKEASAAYEVLEPLFIKLLQGVSKRAAFVIGTDGALKYVEVLPSAGSLPSFDGIKQALAQ